MYLLNNDQQIELNCYFAIRNVHLIFKDHGQPALIHSASQSAIEQLDATYTATVEDSCY